MIGSAIGRAQPQESIKSQLAIQFTIWNHDRADFWEIDPSWLGLFHSHYFILTILNSLALLLSYIKNWIANWRIRNSQKSARYPIYYMESP